MEQTQLINQASLIKDEFPILYFADNYHKSPKSGDKLNTLRAPALLDIYRSMSKEMVIMKCVQIGITEFFLCAMMYFLSLGWSVLYSIADGKLKNTFVANRIDKLINIVPFYKQGLKANAGTIDDRNMKHLWNGTLKLVGSGDNSAFIEFPADIVMKDEIDKSDQENLDMAEDRLADSKYKYMWECGNPSVTNFGTHASYLDSTQDEWFLKCNRCGKWQIPDWFLNVVRRVDDNQYDLIDTKWQMGSNQDIRLFCIKCERDFERYARGAWESRKKHDKIGKHLSQFMSPMVKIFEMYKSFIKALPNPSKMQIFYNSRLGLPYEAAGSKITQTILDKCKRDYALAESGEHCYMGIDVGKYLHVVIRDKHGNAKYINHILNFEDIPNLVLLYGVKSVVIDAMPEERMGRKLQDAVINLCDTQDIDCRVWVCYYPNVKTFYTVDKENFIVNADRTQSLDETVARFVLQKKTLPAEYLTLDNGDYLHQLMKPTRVLDETGKVPRYVWTKGDDHYLHAENYQTLAQLLYEEFGNMVPRISSF